MRWKVTFCRALLLRATNCMLHGLLYMLHAGREYLGKGAKLTRKEVKRHAS